MRKIYWRPSRLPRSIYVLIALVAVVGITAVEIFKVKIQQPHYQEKMKAARIMQKGMDIIKDYRMKKLRKSSPIDPEADPAYSGIIGVLMSPITSNTGYLESKRTTINPNWAAVIVDLLKKADVQEGSIVAMGLSGSFPALNLAALAAAEALKVRVISITSVSASTWGANIPKLTWLDMERLLQEGRVISTKSVAASFGGQGDRGIGLSSEGQSLIRKAIARNGIPFLDIKSAAEGISAKMEIFQSFAEGMPVAAYINIGGGTTSAGSEINKRLYRPGLNRRASLKALSVDCVMTRFAREGVPVINMRFIKTLAQKYGLPIAPGKIPKVGEGDIFFSLEYNYYLVVGILLFLVVLLYVFIKMDVGYRIFMQMGKKQPDRPPEAMI